MVRRPGPPHPSTLRVGGGGGRGAKCGGVEDLLLADEHRNMTTHVAGKFKLFNEGFFFNLKYFYIDEALRGVCLAFFAPNTI